MIETTKDRLLSLIMEGARQNRQEGFGLFKGDMGVCLALFVLNREKKALEPILSRNIIKLQITDNHILSKV